jgi:hypothetical protein
MLSALSYWLIFHLLPFATGIGGSIRLIIFRIAA